ncbi:MAG: peptide-methionine (S)-S-oxide reductase MsrA [Bacteroidetes bacterium]|nr:peptide-methionine (S)-S-oxide reductase MsrA [Bacteroidota bacterium]
MKGFIQLVLLGLGMSYAAAALPEAEIFGSNTREATFAGGNFWYLEAVFESVHGVQDVTTGYAGGNTTQPTYATVQTGATGHAETVNIHYDSTQITYEELLKIYVESMIDPAQADGQGEDRGTQYKSYIFYRSAAQKKEAEDYLDKVNRSGRYKGATAIQVVPFTKFYEAEPDNQDYVQRHYDDDYVQKTALPQLKKFQEEHPRLIEPERKIK